MRYSLKTGIILSATAMILIIVFARGISHIFFASNNATTFDIAVRMMRLFPSFLVFNVVFCLFIKAYQLQGHTRLINILSFSENIIMAVLAVTFTPLIGSDAVWLSFPVSEVICIAVIMVSVFMHAGKITFTLPDWMKLPDSFGAKASQYMEFTISSMEQVINISEKVIDFCLRRGISLRKRNIAWVTVEEMAGNVVQHGFREGRKNYVDLRIVSKDG